MPTPPTRRSHRLSILTVLSLAALIALLTLSLPAGALAKGKPPSGTSGSATVVVTPNPAYVGVAFTVSGCGYTASTQLAVKFISSSATSYRYAASNSSGCFSMSHSTWTAGSYTVEVWQSGSKGSTLKARTYLTVL